MSIFRMKDPQNTLQSLRKQSQRLLGDVSVLNAREEEYRRQPRLRASEQLELAALARVQRQRKALLKQVHRDLDALETGRSSLARS